MQEELRSIAEGLAARIHRAVAIDDWQLRLLVHTAHDENVDEHRIRSVLTRQGPPAVVDYVMSFGIATAEEPVRIVSSPERGMLGRVCVPIRCDGQLFGYLWLIDDARTLTDAQLQIAVDAANAAGQVMYREQLLGSLRNSRERELVRDLLCDDADVRQHAAAELAREDNLPADGRVVVLSARVGPATVERGHDVGTALDVALRDAVRQLLPVAAVAVSRSGGRGTLLVGGSRLPAPRHLVDHATALQASLAKRLNASDVTVAVGPTLKGLHLAYRSHSGAEDAIRVAEVVPGFGQVVTYDELGIYRLLVRLPLDDLPDDAIPSGLRQLLETDGAAPLVDTLETYLDAAGDARATVEQLALHRSSLYYRLARIERLTGANLGNGGDRLAMHLGLKLARLAGLLPTRDPTRDA